MERDTGKASAQFSEGKTVLVNTRVLQNVSCDIFQYDLICTRTEEVGWYSWAEFSKGTLERGYTHTTHPQRNETRQESPNGKPGAKHLWKHRTELNFILAIKRCSTVCFDLTLLIRSMTVLERWKITSDEVDWFLGKRLSCSQFSPTASVRDDRQIVWVDLETDIEEAVLSHDTITFINKHFRIHNLDCCTNLPYQYLSKKTDQAVCQFNRTKKKEAWKFLLQEELNIFHSFSPNIWWNCRLQLYYRPQWEILPPIPAD